MTIGRAGDHRGDALGRGLAAIGAVLVLGVDLLERVHPDDPDVGPGRDDLEAVLGLAALERPDARSEPDEELGDLHATPLGDQVVAELVQEDGHHEGRDDHQDRPTEQGAQAHDDADQQQEAEPVVELATLGIGLGRGWWSARRARVGRRSGRRRDG
jgi:hypothetical protein